MKKREAFGLKPEQANRVDFNFYVEDDVVTIVRRKRGAPLDKIVAELMIFANSTWGKLLHDSRRAGHLPLAGPGRRRLGRQDAGAHGDPRGAAPGPGRGPVRVEHLAAAPLYRPGQPVADPGLRRARRDGAAGGAVQARDATLFSIVSAFDAAYAAYNEFQQNMERYWCLRWLGQENARQVEAVVLKDEVLRLVEIPLVIRLPGMPQAARGAQVTPGHRALGRSRPVAGSAPARGGRAAPEAAAELELEEEEEAAGTDADTGEAAAEEAAEAEGSVTVTDPETQTDVPAAGTKGGLGSMKALIFSLRLRMIWPAMADAFPAG